MNVTSLEWAVLVTAIVGLVVLDLASSGRASVDKSPRAAAAWSAFYIAVAGFFGLWLAVRHGSVAASEYAAAYAVEKSLSVDNLFVFAIIMARFAVPQSLVPRVLLVGVLLALVLRGAFIAVGAAVLHQFAIAFLAFGLFLCYTGIGLARHWDEDPDVNDSRLVLVARKYLPVVDEFRGTAITVRVDGKRHVTLLGITLLAVAGTDVLFALDSIPATFGVTSEPYLVFAANAFALLGLRALFFLLDGLLRRLVYLSLALAGILFFIGVKLCLVYLHEIAPAVPKIPTVVSLLVIAGILLVGVVASLIKSRRDPSAVAHAGRVHGRDPE